MLTAKQVKEIREHLEKAQNPIFFFDNDPDGLCSFLLLQRYIGRGKGIPIRSFPELNSDYLRRVNELKSDYIFILDKPVVSQDFFNEVEKINIPVVWIDHHGIDIDSIPKFVNYYNPLFNKPKESSEENLIGEPVTYLCYQVSQKEEDLWIVVAGCISDKFIPEFYHEFEKKYPDLAIKSRDAFGILYSSQIGKISRMMGFALKDRTTNVINMIKYLVKVKTPYEVLEETEHNRTMHKRFNEIEQKYKKLIERATKLSGASKKVLFFRYSGELSISSDLSNELSYKFPKKIIVVVYLTGVKANISIRGKDVKENILNILSKIDGATGGGHTDAVGAQVKIKYVDDFEKAIKEIYS